MKKQRIPRLLETILIVLGAVVLWELAAIVLDSPFLPAPSEIIPVLSDEWLVPQGNGLVSENLSRHLLPSLARLAAGLLVGICLGATLGMLIGLNKFLADTTGPLLTFTRSLPKTALVPIFLIVFGGGNLMRVAVIAFAVLWPVLLNTISGVQAIPQGYFDAARMNQISRIRTMTHVVLPASAPSIAAGIRISIALAITLLTVSEMVLSNSGLGYVLLEAQRRFNFTGVWAALVIFGALGFGLNYLFVWLEKRILSWHHSTSAN